MAICEECGYNGWLITLGCGTRICNPNDERNYGCSYYHGPSPNTGCSTRVNKDGVEEKHHWDCDEYDYE